MCRLFALALLPILALLASAASAQTQPWVCNTSPLDNTTPTDYSLIRQGEPVRPVNLALHVVVDDDGSRDIPDAWIYALAEQMQRNIGTPGSTFASCN